MYTNRVSTSRSSGTSSPALSARSTRSTASALVMSSEISRSLFCAAACAPGPLSAGGALLSEGSFWAAAALARMSVETSRRAPIAAAAIRPQRTTVTSAGP